MVDELHRGNNALKRVHDGKPVYDSMNSHAYSQSRSLKVQSHHRTHLQSMSEKPLSSLRLIFRKRGRCRLLMKNFDSSNRVNFFTDRAQDAFAVRVRVGHIAGVYQIGKQPTGNHHALV